MGDNLKKLILILCISGITISADLTTKKLIEERLDFSQSISVIPGLLEIVRVHNRGVAFGMFNNPSWKSARPFITAVSVVALGFIIYFLAVIPYQEKISLIALSMILGGACGNIFERITKGYVVDMIYMHVGKYGWPAYNLADAAITIGVFIIIISSFVKKEGKNAPGAF